MFLSLFHARRIIQNDPESSLWVVGTVICGAMASRRSGTHALLLVELSLSLAGGPQGPPVAGNWLSQTAPGNAACKPSLPGTPAVYAAQGCWPLVGPLSTLVPSEGRPGGWDGSPSPGMEPFPPQEVSLMLLCGEPGTSKASLCCWLWPCRFPYEALSIDLPVV